ncbi:cytochrome b/b6 domain-containing protein [Microlunatus capsulatus]|uniref:Cytochrome b561 bacterial/Ni-hydrogenase domain-containing protein n=1 Tax=Microlunatus capsulatus TaxID=99117 RepID=A0ABS4ZDL1_9ACTN|nr:cytochrome b/b6 domain-containing protein [Microlunatus capsulatus]MBP2419138.1 hypothetical protein [Microlunatus capsulatus]
MSFLIDRAGSAAERRVRRFQQSLGTPARTTRTTVVVGRVLGGAFLVCFLTGLYSHFLQDPRPWMRFPTWPARLYQVSQGLHVATGIACIPLLLAKLWTVYPLLFAFPPFRTVRQALERASIGVLVATSVVQLATGLLNTYQWYPFPFVFRTAHYALAWIIVGSLVLHVGVQLPKILQFWRGQRASSAPDGDL